MKPRHIFIYFFIGGIILGLASRDYKDRCHAPPNWNMSDEAAFILIWPTLFGYGLAQIGSETFPAECEAKP